ncbi:hypothetical protein, partial [Exiguobacterium sp. B2(2022)]|uniref:hypothetical protein n=1 Tax=Exiguobacterium sp. B2(2022) TaxID=2992755 RepID=UPI00237ABD32
PSFIKTKGKKRGIFILGSGTETDYLDFIYRDDVNLENIDIFIKTILMDFSVNQFHFNLISDKSILSEYLETNDNAEEYIMNECASIKLSGTYESYWLSLKKNVRQNLRTAENRLKKDSLQYKFEMLDGQKLDFHTATRLQKLYESRRLIKNSNQRSFKKIIIKLYRKILNKRF